MYNYTEYTKKNISIQEVILLALQFVGDVCHNPSVPRTGTEELHFNAIVNRCLK